jgi:UDP-N-acetylmuramoyl-L-alanyl-D-glutamate--2,6-diaminopimelate ligase
MGRFNVYNTLGAISVGLHLGATLGSIATILAIFQTAPGRLERVLNDRGIWVFVDHAHTGPALENVLITLREIARRRVICVFGAGGNRDLQRRAQLAKAAEKYADVSIITSDNPRNEDPASICEQIRSTYQDRSKPIVEVNRKKAITLALEMAEAEDIVLIAGKGHEKMQIFAHQTVPFDDVLVARELLE